MKNLELVHCSRSGMTSIKNNRNLKKRSGFFESYKKIKRKFNLKKQDNKHLKEMNEHEILLLRYKLETEYWTKLIFSIIGITFLVVGVLVFLNSYLNNI